MKKLVIATILLFSAAANADCRYVWVQQPGQLGQYIYVCN
jgi:hypothetical protein